MIDIFNQVFTLVRNALKTHNENITVSSVYTNMPSKFPFVSVEEIENSVDTATSDSCEVENSALVQYEINIYEHTKSKATEILQVVDNLLKGYNFVRVSKNHFQNDNDETIYLYIVRYEAIVSKDHTIYRR